MVGCFIVFDIVFQRFIRNVQDTEVIGAVDAVWRTTQRGACTRTGLPYDEGVAHALIWVLWLRLAFSSL